MRGWLLDMDGVLYCGGRPIRAAIGFLGRLQARKIPYLLLTNHGCLTPTMLSRKLARMGIGVPASCIYTSSLATAEWLAGRGIRRVHRIGERGLIEALRRHGIRHVDHSVRHVVVGLDRGLTYDHMKAACRWIAGGAEFIGTNPDPSYPLEDGLAPECGALLAAIASATGKQPTIIGKPEPAIFQQAARRLGLRVKDLTMVGDRLDTDILGAKRSGVRSVLVLTGHTTRALLKRASIRPDIVVAGLDQVPL